MSQIDGQGKRLRAIGRSAVPVSGLAAVLIGLAALLPSGGSARSQTAPANTGEPQISGSAVQGKTLNASTGTWSGTAPFSFTYRWLRCDKSGGGVNGVGCRSVPGETKNTFLLGDEDVGSRIRVRVTATNDDGKASATSNATAVVEAAVSAPRNTSPPTITGAPQQGRSSAATGASGRQPDRLQLLLDSLQQNGGSCANIAAPTPPQLHADFRRRRQHPPLHAFRPQRERNDARDIGANCGHPGTAAAPPPPPATGCPSRLRRRSMWAMSQLARAVADRPAAVQPTGRSTRHAAADPPLPRHRLRRPASPGRAHLRDGCALQPANDPSRTTDQPRRLGRTQFPHARRLPGQPETTADRALRPSPQAGRERPWRHLHPPAFLVHVNL